MGNAQRISGIGLVTAHAQELAELPRLVNLDGVAEIARVRGEIEQMEAERKQLDRRIEYATLTLEIVEERAAAVNLGPVPIPTRLRLAIADGIASAATSMLAVTLLILRRGPALVLWALLLSPPVWWMLRRRSALKRT